MRDFGFFDKYISNGQKKNIQRGRERVRLVTKKLSIFPMGGINVQKREQKIEKYSAIQGCQTGNGRDEQGW